MILIYVATVKGSGRKIALKSEVYCNKNCIYSNQKLLKGIGCESASLQELIAIFSHGDFSPNEQVCIYTSHNMTIHGNIALFSLENIPYKNSWRKLVNLLQYFKLLPVFYAGNKWYETLILELTDFLNEQEGGISL